MTDNSAPATCSGDHHTVECFTGALEGTCPVFDAEDIPRPETLLQVPLLVKASDLKVLRERLCEAQATYDTGYDAGGHFGRLIAEIDRHRPLGPDGKHGDLHTATCGCER